MNTWQVLAGSFSSLLFVLSQLPMISKALRTKNLKSYSLGNILLASVGNLIYWVYVVGLPVGPVWALHGFSTLTTALMLVLYLRYQIGCTSFLACSRHFPQCLHERL